MRGERERLGLRSRLLRLGLGGLSILIVVALIACLIFFRPPSFMVDRVKGESTQAYQVSQRSISSYCPARLSLDDDDKVGDEELKASEGNLSAQAMFGAFGSVLTSGITVLGQGQTKTLTDPDATDGEKAMVGSQQVNEHPISFTSHLYKVQQGTGSTGSMISWATEGDLKGVQGLRCPDATMEASFLLPSTQQGWTQRLIAYNPSSKATTLSITIRGSRSAGRLNLATGNTMTVAPGRQASFDLSAAVPDQDAIYVTATSSQAPVIMMTTINVMSGLDSRGSDYATPLDQADKELVIPGIRGGDKAVLLARSDRPASLKLSWMSDQGSQDADSHELKAGLTTSIDLGRVPDGKTALSIRADQPVHALVKVEGESDKNQSDFALIYPGSSASSSALTIPHDAKARLSLANGSQDTVMPILTGFDEVGKKTGQVKATVDPGKSLDMNLEDLGEGTAAVRLDRGEHLAWNGRIQVDQVDQAGLFGLAALMPSALTPKTATIHAGPDPGILP